MSLKLLCLLIFLELASLSNDVCECTLKLQCSYTYYYSEVRQKHYFKNNNSSYTLALGISYNFVASYAAIAVAS